MKHFIAPISTRLPGIRKNCTKKITDLHKFLLQNFQKNNMLDVNTWTESAKRSIFQKLKTKRHAIVLEKKQFFSIIAMVRILVAEKLLDLRFFFNISNLYSSTLRPFIKRTHERFQHDCSLVERGSGVSRRHFSTFPLFVRALIAELLWRYSSVVQTQNESPKTLESSIQKLLSEALEKKVCSTQETEVILKDVQGERNLQQAQQRMLAWIEQLEERLNSETAYQLHVRKAFLRLEEENKRLRLEITRLRHSQLL